MNGFFVNGNVVHKNPPSCTVTPSGIQETMPQGHYDKCNICFGGSTTL